MLLLQMLGVDVENLVQYALLLLRRNELLLAILFRISLKYTRTPFPLWSSLV